MRHPDLIDENILLEKLRAGSQLSFEKIYNLYKNELFLFTYKRIGDYQEAQDIIHDLFLNLWKNKESLFITSNLRAYLYQAARNGLVNRYLKSEKVDAFVKDFTTYLENQEEGADYLVRHNMLQKEIDVEVTHLPKRMQQVFIMSRSDGLSHKEIAKKLNISEQSVRSHIKNALRRLRLKFGALLLLMIFIF